jgi:hypothetical protein
MLLENRKQFGDELVVHVAVRRVVKALVLEIVVHGWVDGHPLLKIYGLRRY